MKKSTATKRREAMRRKRRAALMKALLAFRESTRPAISVQALLVLLSIVHKSGRNWTAIGDEFGMNKTVIYHIGRALTDNNSDGPLVEIRINEETDKRQRLVNATEKGEALIALLLASIR